MSLSGGDVSAFYEIFLFCSICSFDVWIGLVMSFFWYFTLESFAGIFKIFWYGDVDHVLSIVPVDG